MRDLEAWETLAKQAIPTLVENCAADSPIRVWAPGCSTGEEAYSLVMLLLEEVSRQKKPARCKFLPPTSMKTPWNSPGPERS